MGSEPGEWAELRLEVHVGDGSILDALIAKIEEVLDTHPHTSVEVIPLLMHYEGPRVPSDPLALF